MFMVSAFILPTFNRFLIMGALVVLALEWAATRGRGENDIFDRAFVLLLAGVIILPYALNLPKLFHSGLW